MTEETVVAKSKETLEIIKGRMPVAVVHLARFGNDHNESTKDLARKFATTVGKIDDVKKSRNFAYVVESTRFTDEQIQEGIDWLKRHPRYDEDGVDGLVTELDAYERATEDEAAAFTAARVAARGQPTRTKDGEVANGGGGNRRRKNADAESDEVVEEPSADDLLD